MKLDVSIIIPNYNTKKLTLDCVDSINKTTKGVSYEVIIVDNASSDGSVKEFAKLTTGNRKIQLIKNDKNLGFAKAVNLGIKISKGEYILLLNSDTLVLPNSISTLIDFAKKTPNVGVVAPQLLNIDNTPQESVTHFPSLIGAVMEYWLGKKGSFELYVPLEDVPIEVDAVVGAAFLIPRKVIDKVGLFDERYFMYFEDLDYCRRVVKRGMKVYYLPASKIIHYHGASGKNVVKPAFQWKRLIPSSKIYHGVFMHFVINFVIWSGQKLKKVF